MAKRRRISIVMQQGLVALFTFGLLACGPSPSLELHGNTMGTTYSVKLPRPPETVQQAALQKEIDGLLARINAEMSTYDPASNLSLLNKGPARQWQTVPARLMHVLDTAAEVHRLSDGVFDPTIGPLVNLWGFGPDGDYLFPQATVIESTLSLVGYQRLLELDVEGSRVRKHDGRVYVDLSAIAKGFAVDTLAELLEAAGISEYMVEIGGEIRVAGLNPRRKHWRLAVENPSPSGRSVHGLLSVSKAAVATSGDYRNFFEHEGRRYSHTIDPRTGYPVSHALVSVTVVHPSAMMADALATALMVLGPEAGLKLAEKENLAVWMILRDGDEWIDLYSAAMQPYRVNFDS